MQLTIAIGEKLICPICGKEFNANKDTCYIISGGYTCSWQCFLNESKNREEERKEKNASKNKT